MSASSLDIETPQLKVLSEYDILCTCIFETSFFGVIDKYTQQDLLSSVSKQRITS